MIFASPPDEGVRADSSLTEIFELVVKTQVEAGKGVLGPIDT